MRIDGEEMNQLQSGENVGGSKKAFRLQLK
jgi:hypothetical protein